MEERRQGLSAREATDVASARTGLAFFTSALTTIGGFAVLIFSALPLLRDFGLIVTLNVAVALLSALVVLPPLLVWADDRGWMGIPKAASADVDPEAPRPSRWAPPPEPPSPERPPVSYDRLVTDEPDAPARIGANEWLVDEMYEQYRSDPASVSESWRDFFADYRPTPDRWHAAADEHATRHRPRPAAPTAGGGPRPAQPAAATDRPSPRASRSGAPAPASWPTWRPASSVPTATSFREVPARLLEVNRKVINGYLGRTRGGKVSFTHLIGYAIVRAIADAHAGHEHQRSSPGADGKPRVIRHDHVGLGHRRRRREDRRLRTLMVPVHQGRRHARLPRVRRRATRT